MNHLVDAPPSQELAQRYGVPHPLRRLLVIAAVGLVAVAALGWLVWVMLSQGRPLVRSDLVSFTVTSEHAAEATVAVVRRNADVEASCLLRAQATDHSIVGELNFEVGPAQPTTSALTRSIRTEREATAVSLVGCVAEGQSRPR